MNPHFSSPFNFGALPGELCDYKKSKVVVLPVPYDATASYRSGARNGPAAIISASMALEMYDEDSGKDFSELGICTLDELDIVVDPEAMANRVYEAVQQLARDDKFVVMLGGEHSLSFGAAKAFREKYPDLSVLHIDAHADMRDEHNGEKFSHACVARRISEICPVVQVGIRSLCQEEAEFIAKSGHKVVYAREIAESMDDSWMDAAISSLSKDVYVTFDLDSLDNGIMPSVGNPEPGGLEWYPVLSFLKRLSGKRNVVGFDSMELSPIPGNIAPDFAAAKLVYKLIGYFCRQ